MGIVVYTDGSYQSSINAGGCSAVIMENDEIKKLLYIGKKNTTNNRMELLGVIMALEYLSDIEEVTIVSDSQYIISNIEHAKRWFEEEDYSKKNLDLWFKLLQLLENKQVTFKWVKGHEENEGNNLADLLAVHAAQCLGITEDIYYVTSQNYKI